MAKELFQILSKVPLFLGWLYEQTGGYLWNMVDAQEYRKSDPSITEAGIVWLCDHVGQKGLVRRGGYLPNQDAATGKCEPISLLPKGLKVAERAYRSVNTDQQTGSLAVHAAPTSDGWVTVTQAAEAIDVAKSTISKLCKRGVIKFRGSNRERRVDLNSLQAYKALLDRKRLP